MVWIHLLTKPWIVIFNPYCRQGVLDVEHIIWSKQSNVLIDDFLGFALLEASIARSRRHRMKDRQSTINEAGRCQPIKQSDLRRGPHVCMVEISTSTVRCRSRRTKKSAPGEVQLRQKIRWICFFIIAMPTPRSIATKEHSPFASLSILITHSRLAF